LSRCGRLNGRSNRRVSVEGMELVERVGQLATLRQRLIFLGGPVSRCGA
jgi:hypothetical protein